MDTYNLWGQYDYAASLSAAQYAYYNIYGGQDPEIKHVESLNPVIVPVNRYGAVTNEDAVAAQLKKNGGYWDSGDAKSCPDCLDPSTTGKNLLGLTYPGGNNPMSMNQKDYNYSYVPTNIAEYPAIGHDRRYDNLKIQGVSGLLTDIRAIGADWRFVKEEMQIAISPFLNPIDRASAIGLGIGLGLMSVPKTMISLSTPSGVNQAILWYKIGSLGVTNVPSVHKH